MRSGIYLIRNLINGKGYIGKFQGYIMSRINQHLAGKSEGCTALNNAVKKYGRENFAWKILYSNIKPEFLPHLERLLVRIYKTKSPNGYNLTDGGDGIQGLKHTKESRKKMSRAHLGKTISKETREKMSRTQQGKIHSKETREKLSLALRGHPVSKETREKIGAAGRGRTHSKETREKMSRTQQGKSLSPEHKRKLSEAHKGRKKPPHSEEHRRKLSESHKKSPRAIEARRKLHQAQLSPERIEAHKLYLSLPLDMDVSKKRELLREKFPDVNRKNIERWVRQWQSQLGY